MQQSGYRNYLLTLLLLILAFNFMDRLVLGVVLQDIKVDLDLNDTELGFFTGIAFAIFYAVMGVPIARWADRGNRVTIISLTAALWSVAVAMCGAATSFIQLMLIRIGVAVGEAGCQPPALSLISDFFSRAERPRAVSLYNLGWPVALVTGYFAGGWLNEWYGWRATFVIIGVPGLVLAVVAVLTLREPRLAKLAAPRSRSKSVQPSLMDVFATMRSNAAFRHVLLSLLVSHFFTYGIMQWQPAFFVRSHGLGTGELGTWLAVVYGGGGLLGTYLGGELAWRYAANNERLQMLAIATLYSLFGVLTAVVYLSPDKYLSFAALGISAIGGAATNGPIFAATQTLMPPRMRAVSVAIILFFCNLIGMGLGPLAAGALSDALQPIFGADSLRYALVVFCPGYFWCAWHLWLASKTVADDVAAVQAEDAPYGAPAINMVMSKG